MKFQIKGVFPALVTPVTSAGKVNEEALRKLIRYVLKGGVHGIFPVGTSGEFYALTIEDKREILKICIDEVKGRVPVYFGAGALTTKECIQLTQMAEEEGADAVSVLTPFFMGNSQDELVSHYKTIAENTKLPVILYNNLPKTGITITKQTVETLSNINNIVGIKDSSGDFSLTEQYLEATRGKDFDVIIGRDNFIHAGLCYGATGAISSNANVSPALCAEIYNKFVAGDREGSLQAQFKLTTLRSIISIGTFPAAIKEALFQLGIDVGSCFAPIAALKEDEKLQVRKTLMETGLLE